MNNKVWFFSKFARRGLETFSKIIGLNYTFYRAAYPDLASLSPTKIQLHYIMTGRREGRISSWIQLKQKYEQKGINPVFFNPIVYLALNPELGLLGISTQEAGAIHFLGSGYLEGLKANISLPSFLDIDNYPELMEKGWSNSHFKNPLSSSTPEEVAALEFQDLVELDLRKLDSEAFAQIVYSSYLGFLPELSHFDSVVANLDSGVIARVHWLIDIANSQRSVREFGLEPSGVFVENTTRDLTRKLKLSSEEISIMGINIMAKGEWFTRAYEKSDIRYSPKINKVQRKFAKPVELKYHSNKPIVSVLCSMYRTDEHLVMFLNGLRSQSFFAYTEFILILVDPSPFELELCYEFADKCPNIILQIEKTRIGIYEAWNIAAKLARGSYITNMNVDDVRRNDSLEKQVEILEKLSWVDVVYQDVMVSLDSKLSWDQIAYIGAELKVAKSSSVTFSSYKNPPHNGPMWRRSLHDDLGYFDTELLSAGDFDFWFRCAVAGKYFYNVTDPHVGYFVNPEGLSTKKDSAGTDEGRRVISRYSDFFVRSSPPLFISEEIISMPLLRAERLTLGVISHLRSYYADLQENKVD